MTNHSAVDQVAASVRAEMARQRKTAAQLAAVLGVTAHTAGRRLNGDAPGFSVVELLVAASWLGRPADEFLPQQEQKASA